MKFVSCTIVEGNQVLINTDNVTYFEINENQYTDVQFVGGSSVMVQQSIVEIMKGLK